jgi:hypothetical protein
VSNPNGRPRRLSVPSPGQTMLNVVRPWISLVLPIFHETVGTARDRLISQSLIDAYIRLFSPIIPVKEMRKVTSEEQIKLASSALISMWILAKMNLPEVRVSFAEAERWFLGEDAPYLPSLARICEGWPDESINNTLLQINPDQDFVEIFPYILESFEIYGGLDLEQDNRSKKRKFGVFYTPSDVAEYIASQVFDSSQSWKGTPNYEELSVLDPACGTGAFLIAALSIFRDRHLSELGRSSLDFVVNHLYGIDKSFQAVQSCVFALLAQCMDDVRDKNISPWRAWQALRGNFSVYDSTLLAGKGVNDGNSHNQRIKNLQIYRNNLLNRSTALFEGIFNKPYLYLETTTNEFFEQSPHHTLIGDIFGERADGFSVLPVCHNG